MPVRVLSVHLVWLNSFCGVHLLGVRRKRQYDAALSTPAPDRLLGDNIAGATKYPEVQIGTISTDRFLLPAVLGQACAGLLSGCNNLGAGGRCIRRGSRIDWGR